MATLLTPPAVPTEGSATLGAGRDVQIERLAALLRSRPADALSLDCFDTVLWRAVPKPTDVFHLLGHRLAREGLLAETVTPELFMRMRIHAEQAARRLSLVQRGTAEVGIEEIYQLPGWGRQTVLDRAELVRRELLVEAELTTADPHLHDLLEEVFGDVSRACAIVSDTYLGGASLRRLLAAAGVALPDRVPVFTSCEHGVSKADGLLALALREIGVAPANCIHVGDSLDADVRPAVKLGATSVHLGQATPLAQRAITVEGWRDPGTEASELLDPFAGDSGLTALRGRLGRRCPSSLRGQDADYWEIGAVGLGPVFTGFAEWVHQRAGTLGIDTALCLMREGEFLADLLNGAPIDRRRCTAVPFWASREACVRSTFFTADRRELSRLLWRFRTPTPEEMLRTLGLRPEELPRGREILVALAQSHGSPDDVANAFLDFIVARQDLREVVVERSAVRRRGLLRYLERSIGRARRVALIDLGFGATIQEALQDIVEAEGVDLDFRGLYLFTSQRAIPRHLRGNIIEGFLADAGSPRERLAVLDRSPEILEVVTTSSAGSLLEFTPEGEPVLAPPLPASEQARQRDIVQAGIKDFQREWYTFHTADTLATCADLGRSRDALHRILTRFIAAPGIEVAKLFSRWDHEENCGSEHADPLVPPVLERCAGHLAPEHIASARRDNAYWLGAVAAYGEMEEPVRWLLQGRAELGTFLNPDRAGELLLTVRPSSNQDSGASTPLLLHPRGAGAIAWRGRCADYASLRLSTSGPSVVLRLDRVRIERADGSIDDFFWRGQPRRTPSGVIERADQPIAAGVALVSSTAAVELSFERPGVAPITGVELLYGALRA